MNSCTTQSPDARRSPWRKDFSTLTPGVRRAARYILQLIARSPALHPRLEDSDFLGALWTLTLPLFDPSILAALQADWRRPDTPGKFTEDNEEEEWRSARPGRRRQRDEGGLLNGIPGARMCAYLKRCFTSVPNSVLKRLAAADGSKPSNPVIEVLADCAGLDAVERALLDFVEKKDTIRCFSTFLRETQSDNTRDHYAHLSVALDMPTRELQSRLHRSKPLSSLHLVRCGRSDRCDLEDFLQTKSLFADLLLLEPGSPDELLAAIVEPAPVPECDIADFPHLQRDAQRLTTVLSEAAGSHTAGINALFYGIPGTGKTAFACAVAKAAGLSAYLVKTADEEGDGLSRSGRLGAYQLTQQLLRGRQDCLIIFDEVEDAFGNSENTLLSLLGGQARASGEKGWMNRILEDNPTPSIWITNDAASMDEAFLRRFLLPVAFMTPPRRVRRQIAERHLGNTAVPHELLDELAGDSALLPAQFSAARKLLNLQPQETPDIVVREGIAACRRLLHGTATGHCRQSATAFDIAYLHLNGGISPARIGEALARSGRGSLCFFGPPGTGKTEFAHVLADALDRELVMRASSDLVSPYVGKTEQNIARLFADIDAEHSVLFLDEIDSLLRDRRQAHHSWEATQVNELLQQMERYRGIFIAATNLMTQVDAAALRRFDFKLEFRPLTHAQRLGLFARETLGEASLAKEIPTNIVRRLEVLDTLTPGDFANVVRQQKLLGEAISPEEFMRRLIVECRYKAGLELAA